MNVLKAIGRGETDVLKPTLNKDDEFENLYTSFRQAIQNLQEYNALKTEKIVMLKKQSDAMIAEMKGAVMVVSKDLDIITMNNAATSLFKLPIDAIGTSMRDHQELWILFQPYVKTEVTKKVEFKAKIDKTDQKKRSFCIVPIQHNDLKTIIIIQK